MKARRISLACILCSVLLTTSGCAFRVLESASEATSGAAQQETQETTAGQPETGQQAGDQPVSSDAGTTGAGTSTATEGEGTSPAAASGESENAAVEGPKAFIPSFGQGGAEAGCQQIILNSAMEEDAAWHFVGGRPARYDPDAAHGGAHSGARSILAGLTTGRPYHIYSDARQWVSIPSKAITATLRLWWYPRTEEQTSRLIERCTRGDCPTGDLSAGPLPAAHDLQYVLAVRPDWSFEWLLRAKANATQWQPLVFDISRYAGRTIAVQFGVYNDARGGLTSMSVDDVEVWVCEQ